MKETFEGNLSETQKEEMDKREAYAQLKAAKEAELKVIKSKYLNPSGTDWREAYPPGRIRLEY